MRTGEGLYNYKVLGQVSEGIICCFFNNGVLDVPGASILYVMLVDCDTEKFDSEKKPVNVTEGR